MCVCGPCSPIYVSSDRATQVFVLLLFFRRILTVKMTCVPPLTHTHTHTHTHTNLPILSHVHNGPSPSPFLPPWCKLIWKRVQEGDALTRAAAVVRLECLRSSRVTNFRALHRQEIVVDDVVERVREGLTPGGRGSRPHCHPSMRWRRVMYLHPLLAAATNDGIHEFETIWLTGNVLFLFKLSFFRRRRRRALTVKISLEKTG